MGGCAEVLDTLSGGNFDGHSSEFRKQNEQKSVDIQLQTFFDINGYAKRIGFAPLSSLHKIHVLAT